MKFNFRQGIQTAPLTSGSPSFLTYNSGDNTVTIVVGTHLVRATAAYESFNYLIEERENASGAWGPFNWKSQWGPEPGTWTAYMYWDINRATGLISRGFTNSVVAYDDVAPLTPTVDKHWFDTTSNTMKSWDGSAWRKVIRVFAGEFVTGTSTITEYQLGSQVGLTVSDPEDYFDHGYILYGADMKGIRYNDTNFVTTATQVNTFHGSFSSPIRLELLNSTVIAAEPIPAFYAVSNVGNGTIQLANGTILQRRPIGIVLQPRDPGDPVDVVTHGIVFNDQWTWSLSADTKDVYCGPTGELVQGSVSYENGATSRIGTVLSSNTILVDVDYAYGNGSGQQGLQVQNYTTSIVLSLLNANSMVRMSSSSDLTVTVPPNDDVEFKIGDTIIVSRNGSGAVSLVAGSGVTINTPSTLILGQQYGKVTITKVATNEWDLEGNLEQ